MKTTELMVGDWVMGSLGDRGRVVAIDDEDNYKTHHGSVRIEYSEDFAANGEWVDKISHIPLTAEILEKNGFERQFEARYSHPSSICSINIDCEVTCFFLEILGKDITCDVRMGLQYVHELQHALRLCGLHKLADNFKI